MKEEHRERKRVHQSREKQRMTVVAEIVTIAQTLQECLLDQVIQPTIKHISYNGLYKTIAFSSPMLKEKCK